jgi:hypothetical protein
MAQKCLAPSLGWLDFSHRLEPWLTPLPGLFLMANAEARQFGWILSFALGPA